jgi:hypothetical protein
LDGSRSSFDGGVGGGDGGGGGGDDEERKRELRLMEEGLNEGVLDGDE